MDKATEIGIATLYHNNFNYGGLLQAFALQKAVEQLGHSCEVVSFESRSLKYYLKRLNHFSFKQSLDAIKRGLLNKWLLDDCILKRRVRSFKSFESIIPHTELLALDDFVKDLSKYEVLVCGSDQVWNPAWWNDLLLLKGVNGKKIKKTAYAASMGCSSLSKRDEAIFRDALADFTYISMREQSGCKLVEVATDGRIRPKVVLDPTLLFDEAQWKQLLPKKSSMRLPCTDFALVYLVDKQGKYTEKCIEACKKNNLSCVLVSYNLDNYQTIINNNDVVFLYDCMPDEWVYLISNASIVLTDSFHGVAFSVNFNKNFWCYRKDETLNGSNKDDRQEAFLKRVGLADRLIDPSTVLGKDEITSEIDFGVANKVLMQERISSFECLRACID